MTKTQITNNKQLLNTKVLNFKSAYLVLFVFCSLLFGFSASQCFAINGVTTDPSRDLLSARQLGMGGVSVAFANDANGVFTNPADLVGLEFPQVTTSSRNIMMEETQYLLAGWAMPTDYGVFGLGYAGLGTSGSLATMLDPGTGRILQDPSREAGSYSSSVIAVSYAREIKAPVKFSVGGNLKLFNQALSGAGAADSGTGLGLDLGANYKALPWLTTGVVLQNLIGSVSWAGSQDKVGGYYKLGAAANVLGANTNEALYYYPQSLVAGFDIDLPSGVLAASSSMLYHLGCEYVPLKNITLRAGLNQETAGTGLTLGIGLVNGGFRFDYAYAQRPGLPGDNPHYFTLSYIGERVLSYDQKLKTKYAHLKFLSPQKLLITDQASLPITVEVWADKVLAQKRIWTVTGVSATFDVLEITTREALPIVFLNGKKLAQQGTVEVIEPLKEGRNLILLSGYTSEEISENNLLMPAKLASAEARVLRVVPFTDAPISHWAIEPISLTGILGLVTGYPDNTFKPEKGITRAELVTLLVKSTGLRPEILDSFGTTEVFKDVGLKHWAAKYIAYGSSIKYVTGYPDGTFQPNKVLNRAEGVAILARYALLAESSAEASQFPDLKADFWANKYIGPAKKAGMLIYLEGKDFKPNDPLTRAEACEVLYRVPAIQKKVNEYWETGIISAAR
jgi:hypothetical protein